MNILFLSQVLPYPLDAGPKMRSYFVLRHLTRQHKVTLLTFVRDSDRSEDIAHLAEFCDAVHTVPIRRSPWRDLKFFGQSLLTQQPFLIIRDQIPAMTDKIDQLVRSGSFDVVHADQLWMAQYALATQQTGVSKPLRSILDQHNAVHLIPHRLAEAESNPVKRFILNREARLLANYEPDVCNQFDHVVWVTSEDRQAVAELPRASGLEQSYSTIIPICADPVQTEPISRSPNGHRVTFLGGLHWPPNAQGILWFAEHVFPQVRAKMPRALLTIIGKDPPAGLSGVGVEVTGYVTDLEPYLSETAVFVVPLHAGGGMRVKILDAWSWGLPIVSTTIGAEGIDVRHGEDILIADSSATFAQAIIRIMADPNLAQRLIDTGRQTVIEKYNWQKTYRAWDEIYQRLQVTEATDI